MSTYKTVCKKEIKGIFRSSGTLLVSLFLPLLLLPILLTAMINNNKKIQDKVKTPSIALFIADGDKKTNINAQHFYEYEEQFKLIDESVFANIEPKYKLIDNEISAFKNKDINLSVTFSKDIINTVTSGISKVEIIYDQNDEHGYYYLEKLLTEISAYTLVVEELRLQAMSTSISEIIPLEIDAQDLLKKVGEGKVEGLNDSWLNSIVATFIVMFIGFGSVAVTTEIFSLEKEKGTLESLFSTSARRKDIYIAKSSVNLGFSLVSFIAQILSLVIAYFINIKYFNNCSIYFQGSSIAGMVITLFSVPIICSALSTISYVFAKSNKEAVAFSSIIQLVPTIISMVLMFIDVPTINNFGLMCAPLIGSIFAFKLATVGMVNLTYLYVSFASNILFAALLFWIGFRRYNSEKALANS